jgi:hypothetical protein
VAVETPQLVRSWDHVVVTAFFLLHSGCSGGNAVVVEYLECCEDVIPARAMPMLASEMCDELPTAGFAVSDLLLGGAVQWPSMVVLSFLHLCRGRIVVTSSPALVLDEFA